MARINKVRFVGWAIMLLAALYVCGCSAYFQSEHARSAFEEAEQFAEEENFDLAIEKYTEAVKLEPGSKTYKLKLVASQTRAAATHVRRARVLAARNKNIVARGLAPNNISECSRLARARSTTYSFNSAAP